MNISHGKKENITLQLDSLNKKAKSCDFKVFNNAALL